MKVLGPLIITDYYLAATLLVIAGAIKISSPGVGDLLETLLEKGLLNLDQIILIARWYPPLEVGLGLFALSGIRAGLLARIMGALYLLFTLLLLYLSEGYLLLPVDCGCFGTGNASPVYLSILRNLLIGLPLFFFPREHGRARRPCFLYHPGPRRG
ncbi:MAG: MauE/DoxX family redox-associated membrane protein [Thermodesulfobacteriota bacterium]